MFENVGEKIKRASKVCFIIEVIASVISGIVELFLANILISIAIFLGGLASYYLYLLLNGFGTIVSKAEKELKRIETEEKKEIEKEEIERMKNYGSYGVDLSKFEKYRD